MTHLTIKRALLSFVIWPGCLTLILLNASAFASGKGYESHHKGQASPHASADMKHHGSSHHKANYSGHGSGHHGSSSKDYGMGGGHASHGKGYGGGHGKRSYGKHGGAHQSASEFIQHVLKYKDGMAITDEQEAKLHDIQTTYKKTRIKMKAEVELANLDLHELLKKEDSNLSDIESKLKNMHNIKADLYMASIKARREAKAVLTDEQRSRMKAVHDRIQAYSSGGMAKKGHPGGYKHHGKDGKKDSY
ncbi:Spy/CpxP family protein refolding chaperone [Nitrospira sp. M1]